ncbi:MAG: diguanylate cyclase [Motiliproteus sp.]|nr:diguanylate cyclase [Motiliproteus sp.]MCW9051194.1 diguanylate cyclase [Motiliproteus sp.]
MEVNSENKMILIVDDNPENVRVLGHILGQQGYQIAVANSGDEALQRLPWIKPDLILLDIMMPKFDGFETCRRLKAWRQTCDIPIIFVSALDDSTRIVRGFEAGAVDYVTKPYVKEILLARVDTHLQLAQARACLSNMNQELRHDLEHQRSLGEHDPLTGMSNRRVLKPRLKFELARKIRQKIPLCVAMIDLDFFKEVNDNCGHQIGDELLIEVSQQLQENLRETDIAIRYGGDEFFLIFPDTTLKTLEVSLDRIQQLLSNIHHPTIKHRVTTSIGAVEATANEDWQSLLDRADKAMYQAKHAGRNQIFCQPETLLKQSDSP